MNPTPDFGFWPQIPAALAVEIFLLVSLAAVLALFARAAVWRRTLWQAVMLAIVVLAVAELSGAASGLVTWGRARITARPMIASPDAVAEAQPTSIKPERPPLAPRETSPTEFQRDELQPAITATTPAASPELNLSSPVVAPEMSAPVAVGFSIASSASGWPAFVWLLGAAALLSRAVVRRGMFALFCRRHFIAARDDVGVRVRAVAVRLGIRRRVRVFESGRLASPVSFGLLRPAVGLPADFAEQFTPEEQEAMLAHELAHIAACDAAWHMLADLVAAALWWHPLVWLARRRLHAASESAADEASLVVADGPGLLAECLVKLGAQLTISRPVGGLSMAGNGFRSSLGQRVERLIELGGRPWQPPRRGRIVLVKSLGTLALLAVVLACAAWMQPHSAVGAGSVGEMFSEAWRQSPAARVLVTAVGTDNPFELFQSEHGAPPLPPKTPAAPAVVAGTEQPASPTVTNQSATTNQNDAITTEVKLRNAARTRLLASDEAFQKLDAQRQVLKRYFEELAKIYLPKHPKMIEVQRKLDAVIREMDGMIEVEMRRIIPQPREKPAGASAADSKATKERVAELIQSGRDYEVIGQFDTAQERFLDVLKLDPNNSTALNYLMLVEEERYEVAASAADKALRDSIRQRLLANNGPFQKLNSERGSLELFIKDIFKSNPTNAVKMSLPFRLKLRELNEEMNRILDRTVEVEKKWNSPLAANQYYRTNAAVPAQIHTSKGRADILRKMVNIRFDEVSFDGIPLPEVVKFISDETLKRDPEKKGINWIINSQIRDLPPPGNVAAPKAPLLDAAGNPIPANNLIQRFDMDTVIIRLSRPIKDVTLAQALDAIVKAADKPIRYSVEDYAIYFTQRFPEQQPLFTRTFRVDPDTFIQGLKSVNAGNQSGTNTAGVISTNPTGVVSTNSSKAVQELVRNFFIAAGASFPTNSAVPTQLFFNDRNGFLMVRASLADLDIIQQAVETLNSKPAHVRVEVRLAEVPEAVARELGLDWFAGRALGALQPDTNTVARTEVGALAATNQNVRLTTPDVANLTSTLSAAQFRALLAKLEQSKGVEILAAPKVITASGREAQVQIMDLQTVVFHTVITNAPATNMAQITFPPGSHGGLLSATVPLPTNRIRRVEMTNGKLVAQVPTGSTADVIPRVMADGLSINLDWSASVSEFLGYERKIELVKITATDTTPAATNVLAQPNFRIRAASGHDRILDGNTLVAGGGIIEGALKKPAPPEGPLARQLVAGKTKPAEKKLLLIFITPAVVDEKGNRIHTDEEVANSQKAPPAKR